ncbi:homoserine acetyltransferase [Lentzea aerocolonigenes]|uniref:Homoserine O-acetyltransferase n=1 Tax=Lentzea aerocolonigenes TaxID=68170 RepID=A0A0F0H414_LENAE|nr:homoserine O-acetyltransferase [Lentzea aerocolonigenes]KJK49606.1 homoserine acetyltransferase [Lentzea aerocolonigenes]
MGGWRFGDPNGRRKWFSHTEPFAGLPGFQLAYETWGTLNAEASNAVLVLHALTGDSHVAGGVEPGHPTPGWWDALIGPGKPLDGFFVVAPNVLGGCQGSTGPWQYPDFPEITIRDQVLAEVHLADFLGVERWAAVLGGSMGGMRAVEWAVSEPDRVRSLLLLATTAAASAEQIGLASAQLHAISANSVEGLGVARRIAHLSYRSEQELQARFGRQERHGRFEVESYLDHHAAKLARRFDAASYVTLTEAMNSHDVGRGRGGIKAALRRVRARTLVAGVDSDRLYPLTQQRELAAGIPGADDLRVIMSPYGHDAFLIESEQVAALVRELVPRTVEA